MMKFLIKAYAEGWVTINGNHVYIGGNGKITKGPAKLVGSTVDDLKGQKMTADKKAELQKKYSGKSASDKSTESPKKEETKNKTDKSESKSVVTNPNAPKGMFGDKVTTIQGIMGEERYVEITSGPHKGMYAELDYKGRVVDNSGTPTAFDERTGSLRDGSRLAIFSKKEIDTHQKLGAEKRAKESSKTSTKPANTPLKDGTKITTAEQAKQAGLSAKDAKLVAEGKMIATYHSRTGEPPYTSTRLADGYEYDLSGKVVMSSTLPTFPSKVSNSPKYPSGIETTAQKRAYTRAVNSGKSSSEATKVAKNAGVQEPSSTVFSKPATTKSAPTMGVAGFSKSQNAQFAKYVSQGMSKTEAADLVLRKSGHSIFGRGKRGGFM